MEVHSLYEFNPSCRLLSTPDTLRLCQMMSVFGHHGTTVINEEEAFRTASGLLEELLNASGGPVEGEEVLTHLLVSVEIGSDGTETEIRGHWR